MAPWLAPVDACRECLVLAGQQEHPGRDLAARAIGIGSAVVHLEPGALASQVLLVAEFRVGLPELDRQLVAAAAQRQPGGGMFFLPVPVVAQDHPDPLAPAKHDPPATRSSHVAVWPLVVGRGQAQNS